jgi:glycosyltransferase involved in cell wall biosynthesis
MWWEEQFGMVLAEAASAGVPIVASDSGAIPEVLHGAGKLFPAGDWRALAAALEEIVTAAPQRERHELYPAQAAADRYAAAYERVLSSR